MGIIRHKLVIFRHFFCLRKKPLCMKWIHTKRVVVSLFDGREIIPPSHFWPSYVADRSRSLGYGPRGRQITEGRPPQG